MTSRYLSSTFYLSRILGKIDFSMYQNPENGNQWNGQHFLVLLRCALNLSGPSGHDRFSDRLRLLEDIACNCFFSDSGIVYCTRFVTLTGALISQLWQLFFSTPAVLLQQDLYSWNEIIASFIHCLIEVLNEILFGERGPKIIVPSEIYALQEKLEFLLAILGDRPFQCTQLVETKNVLEEIESIATEAGIFLRSFFFTMDCVTCAKIEQALSLFLLKFETVEVKIREHCITVPNLPTREVTPSFSIFIVDSVLDDLNHLINNREVDFILDYVKDQIKELYEELNDSRFFLIRDSIDHEMRQSKDLTAIVKQLIDLAYEIEYLVSSFMAGTIPIWYLALRIPDFIQKNKLIRTAFEEIELYSGIIRIEVSESPREHVSSNQVARSDSMVDEIIAGFEEKIIEILDQLVRGPCHLQTISIIGMGGIGKTTLAKELYNHSYVVYHFDRRSWCVVSQMYQKRKLLIDISRSIIKISEEEASCMEEDALAALIYKNLKGKRYLLVIDDIWDKEVWEDVRRFFPNDANGSRILFTSRNKDVADGIINELPLLSVDDCWYLLQSKLFYKGCCPPELEDVGKNIATNCKGLPLVVVGIAGVLANMVKNENSWQKVASGLSSFISYDQDILELSYIHLPARLKPCFLYLGMFVEDKEIPVRNLLYQWISHRFIPKKDGKSAEDVALIFLMELIDRSMVQVAERRWNNEVKTCKVHDLMRDMCLRKAKEENFLKVTKDEFCIYEQHQHLCNHSFQKPFNSAPFGLHIRSLLVNFSPFFAITSEFKLLRVLLRGPVDDTRLEFFVQLRYLEVNTLKLSGLDHTTLEYLLVETITSPAEVLLNMPKLKHVSFKYPVRFCSSWDTSLTSGLETLSGILITNSDDQELLEKFFSLRHLKCIYSDYTLPSGLLNLSSLTLLESLKMTFHKSYIRVISFPNKLKKLTLSRFSLLTSEMLSSIGKLPKLEFLKISDSSVAGGIWNINNDEFQKLKCLKLRNTAFREWNLSADHLPRLERLVLKDNEYPDILPSEIGYIPTLGFLEVYDCPEHVRESAMKIHDEQEEEGNEVLKVIIEGEYKFRLWRPTLDFEGFNIS